MLFSMRPTGLLLMFLLMAPGATSAEGAPRKGCPPPWAQIPGTQPGEPVYLLDGSTVPGGSAEWKIFGLAEMRLREGLGPEAGLAGIICWSPTTGEFEPTFLRAGRVARGGDGVPAINVFLILPKQLAESTRAPMQGLVEAQDAYFSRHSRYAQSLEDLVDFGVPEDTMLEFSSTSAGWSAATPGDDAAYRCFAERTYAGTQGFWCHPGETASRAIKEWYEAL